MLYNVKEMNEMRARNPHVATSVNLEDVCPLDGRVVKFSVSMHRLPNHYNISCKREAGVDKSHCGKEWEVTIDLGEWITDRGRLPEFKITWREMR